MLHLRKYFTVLVCALALSSFLTNTTLAAIGSEVTLLSTDGTTKSSFSPFQDIFGAAESVIAADLGTDGVSEVIVAAARGTRPLVRIFRQDGSKITEFYAYDENFLGGINIAVCDLNNDGKKEIITGSGVGGGPHVRIFQGDGMFKTHFFAFDSSERSGVTVKCGDVDNDGNNEIITYSGADGGKTARVYRENGTLEFTKAATDIALMSYSTEDGVTAEISTPNKYIVVDLSEQRLRAYENGTEVNAFLVSTGKRGFPTPVGKTEITAKIPVMTYAWNYGAGNRNNYYLPGVKWNLRFRKHYYIHSAYWHNNFGHPMSHGCVNTSVKDAEWIYGWAEVGTTVEIVP